MEEAGSTGLFIFGNLNLSSPDRLACVLECAPF